MNRLPRLGPVQWFQPRRHSSSPCSLGGMARSGRTIILDVADPCAKRTSAQSNGAISHCQKSPLSVPALRSYSTPEQPSLEVARRFDSRRGITRSEMPQEATISSISITPALPFRLRASPDGWSWVGTKWDSVRGNSGDHEGLSGNNVLIYLTNANHIKGNIRS
jgi:hypothetical protein